MHTQSKAVASLLLLLCGLFLLIGVGELMEAHVGHAVLFGIGGLLLAVLTDWSHFAVEEPAGPVEEDRDQWLDE